MGLVMNRFALFLDLCLGEKIRPMPQPLLTARLLADLMLKPLCTIGRGHGAIRAFR